MVERGDKTYIPDGNFVIEQGDKVYVIGEPSGINRFFKQLGRVSQKIRSVFIVGGGRIAYYLNRLMSDFNVQSKIVEKDEARCRILAEDLFPKA